MHRPGDCATRDARSVYVADSRPVKKNDIDGTIAFASQIAIPFGAMGNEVNRFPVA